MININCCDHFAMHANTESCTPEINMAIISQFKK